MSRAERGSAEPAGGEQEEKEKGLEESDEEEEAEILEESQCGRWQKRPEQ
ncbi:hypothetical protein chiPu_0028696, partial [Chiloscyllium punctatum]|nr:hypothetical protein [Chiloscyllium punctatum]